MTSNAFLFETVAVFSKRLLKRLSSDKAEKLLKSQRDSEQESNQIQLKTGKKKT